MAYTKEPEFQIYQCGNQHCRFRCSSNLSASRLERCPLCGNLMQPQGLPFTNQKMIPGESLHPINHLEILLDNLRSTLNVGSIFRTADGAGVAKIHLCGTTPTPDHPKIAKTGLGAELNLPWQYHRNGLDFVLEQKSLGVNLVALETCQQSTTLFDNLVVNQSQGKKLLIVGNEVSGVDPEILSESDTVIRIPMVGKKSSLNVAVAFGIAIYALQRFTNNDD